MTVKIEIPTPLRAYTNNQKRIEITANSVESALSGLISTFPKLKPQLYEGEILRTFVNIYLNDEDVRFLENKYTTTVKSGDTISIIPSIAGGI